MTLVRRAQLAVIAHIRHVYTYYDDLLKREQWQAARSKVEQATLDKLMQWRGDEDDADDIDEILREVIVIPDDDDERGENQIRDHSPTLQRGAERDDSVEIISPGNFQTEAINYASTIRPGDTGRIDSPNSDDVEIIQHDGQPLPYLSQHVYHDQRRQEQIEAHRRRRWEEARDRRRNETSYMIGDCAAVPKNRSFATVPLQQNKFGHEVSYDPEPRHLMTEASALGNRRPPAYTRLIPLPREVEPDGKPQGPGHSLSRQVSLCY